MFFPFFFLSQVKEGPFFQEVIHGDTITKMNGRPVESVADFVAAIESSSGRVVLELRSKEGDLQDCEVDIPPRRKRNLSVDSS